MVTELEAAKAAVESNARSLQLLDDRIACLQKLLEGTDEDVGQYPYFYGAIGADDLEGIRLGPLAGANAQRNQVYEGRIEIQEDAPFVWTHILTAYRNTDPANLNINSFQGIFYSAEELSTLFDGIHLGFIERGSGHELFQAELLSPAIAAATSPFNLALDRNIVGQVPVGSTLNTPSFYPPPFFGVGPASGGPFDQSAGTGPNFAYPLSKEVLLPASGVMTVQAKIGMNSIPGVVADPPRVFVTLLGYKIFGE